MVTEKYSGSFEEYITDTKKIVLDNRLKRNPIGGNIRNIGIDSDFIDANLLYFKEQYECGYSPENVLKQIETDTNELYIKMNEVSDDYFIDEVNYRHLGKHCINDVDTEDLEYELDGRWDSSYKNIHSLTRDELLDLLGIEEGDIIESDNIREVICKALGLNNSFAYSMEEIIEVLRKKI